MLSLGVCVCIRYGINPGYTCTQFAVLYSQWLHYMKCDLVHCLFYLFSLSTKKSILYVSVYCSGLLTALSPPPNRG